MNDYEKNYEEFWKEIIEDKNGNVNLDQVKRELYDYQNMLDQVPQVYIEIANVSKPNTRASYIISELYDRFVRKDYILEDLLEYAENGFVSIEDIKEYFR